ncbi:Zn(2)-C6 fungal-type DNA-binding domain protein [Niveomyces insectorum RCEF 264]|uniref:Zn(2)-C6 fungal-type DNA-binding domain protein n=1 Tax=Niveomyces insectorum RCEF 264 TaxID=1081102 RepID=A0A167TA48_9HYPO|nr:Zn(2)-C6 fungal-type DNA-binding domain protein [Niveomyces insectorum RCEF 264]
MNKRVSKGDSLGSRRTTTGCLTCRRRKKKCDEARPSCAACIRNKVPCTWPDADAPHKRKPQLRRQQGYNKDFAVPYRMVGMMTVFAVPSPSLTDRLGAHFIESSPNWISSIRGHQGAEFLRRVMPSALQSQLVLECVLTVAAADLCKLGDRSKELEQLSYECYGLAAAKLSSIIAAEEAGTIQPGNRSYSPDHILLAILILCVHETINFSSSDRLLIHINGAAMLLSRFLYYTPEDPDLRGFLLELFCYFYTLAASTHGSRMSLDLPLAAAILESPWLRTHANQGMLLGDSPEIFLIILRLSVLLHGKSTTTNAACHGDALDAQLSSIQLDLWRSSMEPVPPEREASSGTGSHADAGKLASELYFWGCQIQIELSQRPGRPKEDETIQALVSTCMAILERIPSDDPANGVLCWPLFVVGLCAVNSKHRAAISNRLQAIYAGWRSAIPLQTSKYLTQRWKQEKNEAVRPASATPTNSTTDLTTLNLPFVLV